MLKKLIYVVAIILALVALVTPAYAQLEEMILNNQPYGVNRVDYQVAPEQPAKADVKASTSKKQTAKEQTAKDQAPEHYRVVQGDTLWGLANKFSIPMEKLAALNGLTEQSQLYVGQVINVPGSTNKHLVQSGETLTGICREYGISLAQLLKANNITNPNFVKVGQTLTIPSGEKEAVPAMANDRCYLPVLAMNWPVEGRVSSGFGIRGDEGRPHEGIDIAANQGALITAPHSGEVVFSGPYGTYGNTIIIDHGDSTRSLYAHCSVLLASSGQRVQAGDAIARVGNTGRSTGPHLHWEVTYKGVPVDPMFCIEANSIVADSEM